MGKSIPDRWLNYQPIGERIAGTRFIAFKVPLRQNINETVDDEGLRLAPHSLLESVPNLGLIVDLTNTNRYYNPQTFTKENVEHQKLMIPGHQTPSRALAKKFCQYVTNFLEANADNDKLIGVHCTHGVNRTGYLICYFMITKLNMSPVLAIKTFADARGHKIERENYTSSLLRLLQRTEQPERSPSIRGGADNAEQNERPRKSQERRDHGQRLKGGAENWRQRSQEQQPESWQHKRNYATPRSYDHRQERQTYTKWRKFSDNDYAGRREEEGSRTSRYAQQSWRYGQPEADRGYGSSSSSRNHSSNRYKYVRENNGYGRDGDNYQRRNNYNSNNGNNYGNKANNFGNNGYHNGHSRHASTSRQRHRYSNGEDY